MGNLRCRSVEILWLVDIDDLSLLWSVRKSRMLHKTNNCKVDNKSTHSYAREVHGHWIVMENSEKGRLGCFHGIHFHLQFHFHVYHSRWLDRLSTPFLLTRIWRNLLLIKLKFTTLDANDNLRRFHFLLHKKFNLIGSGGHIALFSEAITAWKKGPEGPKFLDFS